MVCGRYRTGKSFLLNQLCGEKGAFGVGHTVESHTRGIWLHAPRGVVGTTAAGEELDVVFMDSEGLGSTEQDPQHDATLFSLAVLLCSMLVYNSVGAIDEDSLQQLSFVAQLTKRIRVRAAGGGGGGEAGADEWAAFMPTFTWVLRDFSLALEDAEGAPISCEQYLEDALTDAPGFDKDTAARNRVRRHLKALFPSRACATLPLPVADEGALARLGGAAPGSKLLRREFVAALDALRDALLHGGAAPKAVDGRAVSGPMLAALAGAYVSAINAGGVPTVVEAWEAAAAEEVARVAEAVGAAFAAAVAGRGGGGELPRLPAPPVEVEALASAHSALAGAALKMFDGAVPKGLKAAAAKARASLAAAFADALGAARAANEAASADACSALLRALVDEHVAPAAAAAGRGADDAARAAEALAGAAGEVEAWARAQADAPAPLAPGDGEDHEAEAEALAGGCAAAAAGVAAAAAPAAGLWAGWAAASHAYGVRAVGPAREGVYREEGREALEAAAGGAAARGARAAAAAAAALAAAAAAHRAQIAALAARAAAGAAHAGELEAALALLTAQYAEATAAVGDLRRCVFSPPTETLTH